MKVLPRTLFFTKMIESKSRGQEEEMMILLLFEMLCASNNAGGPKENHVVRQ